LYVGSTAHHNSRYNPPSGSTSLLELTKYNVVTGYASAAALAKATSYDQLGSSKIKLLITSTAVTTLSTNVIGTGES
jgi:hypothetical protein